MLRQTLGGTVAGAAGATALNAMTYGDMALRGRGGSSAPEQVVERLSDAADVPVPGEGETRDNRISGLGPLVGLATGVGVGTLYGVARGLGWRPPLPLAAAAVGLAAMAGSDAPLALLEVSDPRRWSADDWLMDAVPHLVFGLATAAAYEVCAPRASRTERLGRAAAARWARVAARLPGR